MNKNIIVYDFDKTIYGGESGTNFSTFYLKKYPTKAIKFLFFYMKDIFYYLFKIINLKQLKERYFEFLEIYEKDKIQELVDEFWEEYKKKIHLWTKEELIENKKEADLVIVTSATPLFLIKKFVLSLGYDLVFGTEFEGDDKEKFISKIKGENNKGIEKVKKLDQWANKNNIKYTIIKFYSDSLADKPLYDIAQKKYWIKKGIKSEGVPTKRTLIDILFWK